MINSREGHAAGSAPSGKVEGKPARAAAPADPQASTAEGAAPYSAAAPPGRGAEGEQRRPGQQGTAAVAQALRSSATPITDEEVRRLGAGGEAEAVAASPCLDAVMEHIGSRRWVLMGEATHGSHEFYALKAALTRRLVSERGFRVIAVEGAWHECFRVNRFLRSSRMDDNPGTFPSEDETLEQAMGGFVDFPGWVWRNEEMRRLLEWISAFNASVEEPVRFYGLDLQGSLQSAAEDVVGYADRLDPDFAAELRAELRTFLTSASSLELGLSLAQGELQPGLEGAGTDRVRLQRRLEHLLATMQRRNRDDFAFLCPVEEALSAEQNLDVLLSGQEYYAKHHTDGGVTWNLRDQHMVSTVMRLLEHLEVHSAAPPGAPPPGIVVWAHNSHIGDARATDRGRSGGQWNLGHMVRETFGTDVTYLLGLTTAGGEVYAAPEWGQPGQRSPLRPPAEGSWEAALREGTLALRDERQDGSVAGLFWPCGGDAAAARWPEARATTKSHRLVGVVYRPEQERAVHMSEAELT